jgi:hypothetical protein
MLKKWNLFYAIIDLIEFLLGLHYFRMKPIFEL